MSKGSFDFWRSPSCPSPQHGGLKNYEKEEEDLAIIYSFKKSPKRKARKVTPVSMKMTPFPNCRPHKTSGPCWSVQEENEEAEINECSWNLEKDRTEAIFAFDEECEPNVPDKRNENDKEDRLSPFSTNCVDEADCKPASFSDYTEKALERRIEHEMEKLIWNNNTSVGKRSGVSPLLRKTVVSNTLKVRKTTVDSGYSEDLDGEKTESDAESVTFDNGSSDEERINSCSPHTSDYSEVCERGFRRRKLTPIPITGGPSNRHIVRGKGKQNDKSCVSLEEEDYEDVENFNSDDDFVDMGLAARQSSRPARRNVEPMSGLSHHQDQTDEARIRSFSSPENESRKSCDDQDTRRRKRAFTVIPSLGELEHSPGYQRKTENTTRAGCETPLIATSETDIQDQSSSTLLNVVRTTVCQDLNPAIKVQTDEEVNLNDKSPSLEEHSEGHKNETGDLNALGEHSANQKGVTRRKLTPADIGHPCLGKMKELRKQMVGLHLAEDDEGSDHKSHPNREA